LKVFDHFQKSEKTDVLLYDEEKLYAYELITAIVTKADKEKLNTIYKLIIASELEKTPEVIIHTGLFDNIDKLYGKKPGEEGTESEGEEGATDLGADLGGDLGAELGGPGITDTGGAETETPETSVGGETVPESKEKDLNLILETNNFFQEDLEINLSKAKNPISQISKKLGELLNE
jgi:hypothetical protein